MKYPKGVVFCIIFWCVFLVVFPCGAGEIDFLTTPRGSFWGVLLWPLGGGLVRASSPGARGNHKEHIKNTSKTHQKQSFFDAFLGGFPGRTGGWPLRGHHQGVTTGTPLGVPFLNPFWPTPFRGCADLLGILPFFSMYFSWNMHRKTMFFCCFWSVFHQFMLNACWKCRSGSG